VGGAGVGAEDGGSLVVGPLVPVGGFVPLAGGGGAGSAVGVEDGGSLVVGAGAPVGGSVPLAGGLGAAGASDDGAGVPTGSTDGAG
jgi:hypothetical protein